MIIRLCNITDFFYGSEDNVDFKNPINQDKYFRDRTVYTFEAPLKADANLYYIPIDKPLQELEKVNYCYYEGLDHKYYYYFIMDRQFRTEKTTYLYIKLDVLQTYMFDFELLECFIDRCHVDRWTKDGLPTREYENEGVGFGENILKSYEDIAEMGDSIIFATTTPIGKLATAGDSGSEGVGGGSTVGNCGDWKNGVMSSKGFRFMKGYEGFGKYLYKDSGGVLTIGYGVTKSEPNEYNDLVSKQPVDEEYASKLSYKLKQEKYGKPIVNFCKQIGITQQNQFDALCDLAFNAGVGAVIGTPEYTSLPNALKKDPFNESYIRPIWEKYIIKDDHETPQGGLVARRKAECDIYFKNVYEFRSISTINPNGSDGPPIKENNGNGWLPTCESGGNKPIPNGKYVNNKAGDNWLLPVKGSISSVYPAYPSGKPHNALDIACPIGTPVWASKDGVVIDRKELTTSYGYFLKIQHGDSLVIYAHNSELLVNIGDHVKQGQVIAKSGDTGNSTGPHCHFEIRNDRVGEVIQYNTKTVNPYPEAKLHEEV